MQEHTYPDPPPRPHVSAYADRVRSAELVIANNGW